MPFATSSFLFLVVMPGAISSVLAPSSDAPCWHVGEERHLSCTGNMQSTSCSKTNDWVFGGAVPHVARFAAWDAFERRRSEKAVEPCHRFTHFPHQKFYEVYFRELK